MPSSNVIAGRRAEPTFAGRSRLRRAATELASGSGMGEPCPSGGNGLTDSVTQLLRQARAGDSVAGDRAYELVYEHLRRAAHRQLRGRNGQTLCTTALVSEAWLKLASAELDVRDREHYLALATRAMRQIVVDQARRAVADKRGGAAGLRITLDAALQAPEAGEDVLALDSALQRLAHVDPRLAKVVEWRYFGGLTDAEMAALLGVTERTINRDWRKARAFLYGEIAIHGQAAQ
jgi:RNA polymerase sigma factor (TIGR02999 family)